jgi:hypothetical protein
VTTSNTYSFALEGVDFINAAFRIMQTYGAADAGPTSQDMTNAAQAFEILVKAMAIKGLPLWAVQSLTVPMIAGQATYSLGSPRPLRILDARLSTIASGNDVSIQVFSRYDYDLLGQKAAQGVPNQLFYDPQIGNTVPVPGAGIITVYDVPSQSSTWNLILTIQRSIQDIGTTTNNVDFPQEAYLMLKWNLADQLALEYEVRPDLRQEIAGRAKTYADEFFAACQEQASVYFTPSQRDR